MLYNHIYDVKITSLSVLEKIGGTVGFDFTKERLIFPQYLNFISVDIFCLVSYGEKCMKNLNHSGSTTNSTLGMIFYNFSYPHKNKKLRF